MSDHNLSGYQARLADLMSDISEDCWCAGWLSCNEYALWGMVADPTAERRYGFGYVEDEQVAELMSLAQRTGGWIIYFDDAFDPDAPVEDWGERFIPMAEWIKLWDAFNARAAATMAQTKETP